CSGYPRLQQFGPANLFEAQSGAAEHVAVAQPDPGKEPWGVQRLQGMQRDTQVVLKVLPAVVTATSQGDKFPSKRQCPLLVSGGELMRPLALAERKVGGDQCCQFGRDSDRKLQGRLCRVERVVRPNSLRKSGRRFRHDSQ